MDRSVFYGWLRQPLALAGWRRAAGAIAPRRLRPARRTGSTSAWSGSAPAIGGDDSARLGLRDRRRPRARADRGAHASGAPGRCKLATALGVLHGRIVARAPCDDLAVLEVHPRIPGLAALPAAPAGRRPAGSCCAPSVAGAHDTAAPTPRSRASRCGRPADRSGRRSPSVPLPAAGDSARLAAGARGLGRPGDRRGRTARRHGRGDGRARRDAPAVAVPWARIRERLARAQARPAPRLRRLGASSTAASAASTRTRAPLHPGFRASDARLDAPIAPTRLPGTEGMDG